MKISLVGIIEDFASNQSIMMSDFQDRTDSHDSLMSLSVMMDIDDHKALTATLLQLSILKVELGKLISI